MVSKTEFEIKEVHRFELKKHLEIAKLYCQIWKEPPWNEYFWTEEKVVSDIKEEMARPRATMFIAATADEECVGFTWGYEVPLKDLREISGSNILNSIFTIKERIFYIDELGVKSEMRSKGLGKKLALALIEKAREAGCTYAALRTDKEALAAIAVYAKIGFKEIDAQDAIHEKRNYWLKKLKTDE